MLSNILSKLTLKIKILHNIYIKHKYYLKKKSYAMEGEDLVILKNITNKSNNFYVDVGCYHPLHLNNTYLLYKKGWRGINIDVSKYSIDLFNYMRPDDMNIEAAISNNQNFIKVYYQKKLSQLTTTKKEISQKRMQGHIKEKEIKAKTLNSILNHSKYKNQKIDFLNIDIEGADLEALQSLDFNKYRPNIICVEIDHKKISNSETYKYLDNLKYEKIWSSNSNISHIFISKI